MGEAKYSHPDLASGRWGELSIAEQMGNIGSEVSRSLKWYSKNQKIFEKAFDRTLELFDLSIADAVKKHESGYLKELCRAREEFCDYFFGNTWGTDPQKMQRYYDAFVSLR